MVREGNIMGEGFRYSKLEASDIEGSREKQDKEKKFRELALELLELHGLLEKEKGHLVVDINAIKEVTSAIIDYKEPSGGEKKGRYTYFKNKDIVMASEKKKRIENVIKELSGNFREYYNGSIAEFLLNTFRDLNVVDKKDWESKKNDEDVEIEEKPLLYEPKNGRDAFDINKIKEAKFHLGVWELNKFKARKQNDYDEDYSPEHPGLSYEEVSLAALIYNSEYGDGRRDENGDLLVRDGDKIKKINLDWLMKHKFSGRSFSINSEEDFFNSPALALKIGNLPQLSERGLLKDTDFESMSESKLSKEFGQQKIIKHKKGTIIVAGVRYNFGSKFGGGKYMVYKLTDKIGALSPVDVGDDSKNKRIEYVFDLVDKNDHRVKKSVNNKGADTYRFGPSDGLEIRPYTQSEESYYLKDISQYPQLLDTKGKFVRETGISLEQLLPREQVVFLRYYDSADSKQRERINNFVKIYKQKGISSFLLIQFDSDAIDKILNFSEKSDIGYAEQVFKRFSGFKRNINNIDGLVADFFRQEGKNIDFGVVVEEIVKKGSLEMIKIIENPKELSIESLKEIFEKLDVDVATFASIFKTAFKGKERVDFEDVRGLDYGQATIEELRKRGGVEIEEMIKIAESNWKPRGEAGEGVLREFMDTLKKGENIDFHILKKDGKVIAFVRFEPIIRDGVEVAGHKYAGSFNVDPNYRGSAVGEAMISNAIEEQANKYILEATVHPDISVGTMYVEKTGFSIIGTIPNYDNIGVTFFEIICDKKRNELMESRDVSEKDLIKLAQSQKDLSLYELKDKEEIIVKSFDTIKDKEEILSFVDILTENGFIGTRYFADPRDREHRRIYVFEKDKMVEEEREIEERLAA